MYNVFPENWKSIDLQKIKLASDKNIAEFNNKLLHNMLCCEKIMFNCVLKLKIFNILYNSTVRVYEAIRIYFLLLSK